MCPPISKPTDPGVLDLIDQLPKTEFGSQQSWTNGKVRFEFFPEGYIALNRELSTGLHPKLEKLLEQHPVEETDIRLSVISLYAGVILDGTYTLAERDKLCFTLAGRLEVLRELPTSGPQIVLQ